MFKDILVHLDDGPRSDARLRIALDLARRHGARLSGLAVIDLPGAELFFGTGMPFVAGGTDQMMNALRAEATAHAVAAEGKFRDAAQREGVEGEWRVVEGDTVSILAAQARHADLTVVGQPNDEAPFKGASADAVLVGVMLSSGRPVLAIPYAGRFERVGERVLIAWNGSREASRAVHDALPLLRGATVATVLTVNPEIGGDASATSLAAHLARHGVNAKAAHTIANDIGEGDALLSYAADLGADLIVAGGYGHSRAREMVFGGVTRTLIQQMTVPMLLSH